MHAASLLLPFSPKPSPSPASSALRRPSASMSGLISQTVTDERAGGVPREAAAASAAATSASRNRLNTRNPTSPVPPATSRWWVPATGAPRVETRWSWETGAAG